MRQKTSFRIALRYLRSRPDKRSVWTFVIPLFFLLLAVGWWMASRWLESQFFTNPAYFEWHQSMQTQYGISPSLVLQLGKYFWTVVVTLVVVWTFLWWQSSLFPAVSAFGLLLGTASLILVLAVMAGYTRLVVQSVLQLQAHVEISAAQGGWLPYRVDMLTRIRQTPGVLAASPFVRVDMLLQRTETSLFVSEGSVNHSLSQTVGVVVKGIDLSQESSSFPLNKAIPFDLLKNPARVMALGTNVTDKRGLVLNNILADQLHIIPGEEVSLMYPWGGMGPTGSVPIVKRFRVVSLFPCTFPQDQYVVFVSLEEAQKLIATTESNRFSGIEISGAQAEEAPALAERLRRTLLHDSVQVATWQDIYQTWLASITLERVAIFIGLSLILLIAAFSIVSNGSMWIAEKEREISILKTMGAQDRDILSIFLWMGCWTAGLGIVLGCLLGMGGSWAVGKYGVPFQMDQGVPLHLPIQLEGKEIVRVCLCAGVLSLLAILYPAWVASRQRPVERIRG